MDIEAQVGQLKAAIRDVPDFPKPGIVFKDITTLLRDPVAFRRALDLMTVLCGDLPAEKVVAIESRGFILGGALADRLGAGFVPVRKPGKLPWKARRVSYELEYGQDELEMHEDALAPGDRVLVVDDVIATGGTARAVGDLCEAMGAKVSGFAFLVELTFLKGRERLAGREARSLLRF
ncbi:MAG TPA: adenine phosphoribosyltransferase [Vicinamibacteria bacterium]|nr:adenine phosphoribosyltransferase [Vicinamibacteria bacterium]